MSIGIPTQVEDCKNPHSRDEEHLEACDWYDAEVLEGIQESAEATLPKPKGGAKNSGAKITHGFRENVQPSKDKAHFWHSVWKSAGRPINTQLHTIMKQTRNQYHKNVKQCQRTEDTIRKSKLLEAFLNGNGDLVKEI